MTLGTKDFMALSHAQCAMKASDMAYRLEAAEKLIEQLEKAVFSASETFSEYESIHLSEEPPDTCKAEFINWRGRQMSKALAAAKQWKEGV